MPSGISAWRFHSLWKSPILIVETTRLQLKLEFYLLCSEATKVPLRFSESIFTFFKKNKKIKKKKKNPNHLQDKKEKSQPEKKKKITSGCDRKDGSATTADGLQFQGRRRGQKSLIQIKNQEICMENRHRARSLADRSVGGVHSVPTKLRPHLFA